MRPDDSCSEMVARLQSPKPPLKRIPISIWALGLVSMFMDISSEMIHSLLPLFLVGTLGAGAAFATLALIGLGLNSWRKRRLDKVY